MEQSSIDNRILSKFIGHMQSSEIARKCIEKVNLDKTDSDLKKQTFLECYNSRINIFGALNKEKLEKA